MLMLADELLVLTLSPAEPRNMRAHPGIRAAVCGANVLDLWLENAPLPDNLRRHIRKNNLGALDPALERLVAAGRITNAGPRRNAVGVLAALAGAKADTLIDVDGAAAARDRPRASLAGPDAPPARDAALAVLIYTGRLWNWSGLEAHSTEDIRIRGKRQPAATPLKRLAQAIAEKRLVPDYDTAGVLAGIVKAIDHEYVHHGD